ATASKGAQTTSPTSSYTARRGRPRKTTPPSAEQPAAKVISIDIESEDEASKPVDVAVSGSSTHDKGKALVDHSSDSTDFAEVEEPPVVKRGRPRGRPRKTDPHSTEHPAAKVTRIDIASEDEANKPVDVAGSGSSARDKGKALVDHFSDSTDFSEDDEPPVAKQSRPRGRPRKIAPPSAEQPAAKATRVEVENEDEASEDVASKSVEVDAPPVVKRGRPRGRPRKIAPPSAEQPAAKVTRINIEGEDEA
ncbi:hypothetical protein H4S07_006522, partial [Coemansia furcata]